jgi:hypothetical protein
MGETPDDTKEMMLEGDEDLSPDEIPDDMFDSGIDEESPEDEPPEEDIPAEIPGEESFEEEIPTEEPAEEEPPEETGIEDDSDSAEKPDSEIPVPESVAAGAPAVAQPRTGLTSVAGIKSVAVPDMLGLMNYLKGLSKSLPESERKNFMQSDARVSMEYLIDTMEGHKGLRKGIEEKHNSVEGAAGKGSLSGTLGYLEKLAGALPDQDLAKAISRKMETVISALGEKTNG